MKPTIEDLRLFVQSSSAGDYLAAIRRQKEGTFQFPKPLRIFLLVFGMIWLGVTSPGFYSDGKELIGEVRFALNARPVEATVRQTRPASTKGEVAVTLAYRVGGREYTTTEFLSAKDPRLASRGPEQEAVKITLYCDPDRPALARLTDEPSGSAATGALFMMPFLAVGLGMLGLACSRGLGTGIVRGFAFIVIYTPLSCISSFVLGAAGIFLPARLTLWIGVGMLAGYPIVCAAAVRLLMGHFYRKLKVKAATTLAEMEKAGANGNEAAPNGAQAAVPADAPSPNGAEPAAPVAIGVEAEKLSPASIWRGDGRAGGLGTMVGLLLFATFWCGITGAFVGFIGHALYKQSQVRAHYAATEGNVLSSKVATSSSDDGTTYAPKIQYAYQVAGQEYRGSRYSYGEVYTSGRGEHQRVVDQYPPGKRVAVYYDPQKPSESVLSLTVQSSLYAGILFMQPFVLIGLGMLAWVVSIPIHRRRVRQFLQGPADMPCRIPTWGLLHEEVEGVVVRRSGGLGSFVGGLAGGYGLATFVLIFVVAFAFDGGSPPIIAAAFALALLAGVLCGRWGVRLAGRKAAVSIDRMKRSLVVKRLKVEESVRLTDIECWLLRMIDNPGRARNSEDKTQTPLLSVLAADGREVPVHVFQARSEAPAIARRAAEALAGLTHRPVRFVESSSDMGRGLSAALGGDLVGAVSAGKSASSGGSPKKSSAKDLDDLT